jgi:ParB family chromosome partitioning protein
LKEDKKTERVGIKELFKINTPINENIKPNQLTDTFNPFEIVKVSVFDIEPHPNNIYSVEDIQDLKDSIELMGGVQQNLILKPIENQSTTKYKYTAIAGHRRTLASIALVQEGKPQYELVPCTIKTNMDSIKERILLIHTNSTTRVLSDWEKTEQLKELKILFAEYKKEHNLPGRIQELLAETLNISKTQVGRYERIDSNLTDEYKEEFKKGNVNFSTAAELATLSVADQKAVYQDHKEKGTTKLKDVQKIKRKPDECIIPGTQHLTVNAANKIKKNLEQRLSLAEHDRRGEILEKTETTEYIRLLNLLIKIVDKEVFAVMGGNIFVDK